jgi:hypothetical protein
VPAPAWQARPVTISPRIPLQSAGSCPPGALLLPCADAPPSGFGAMAMQGLLYSSCDPLECSDAPATSSSTPLSSSSSEPPAARTTRSRARSQAAAASDAGAPGCPDQAASDAPTGASKSPTSAAAPAPKASTSAAAAGGAQQAEAPHIGPSGGHRVAHSASLLLAR